MCFWKRTWECGKPTFGGVVLVLWDCSNGFCWLAGLVVLDIFVLDKLGLDADLKLFFNVFVEVVWWIYLYTHWYRTEMICRVYWLYIFLLKWRKVSLSLEIGMSQNVSNYLWKKCLVRIGLEKTRCQEYAMKNPHKNREWSPESCLRV